LTAVAGVIDDLMGDNQVVFGFQRALDVVNHDIATAPLHGTGIGVGQ